MPSETLTSRERVIRVLNHEPVDRMPIDLGSHFSTGISAFAYWDLREHLGLSTDEIWVPDVVQMLAWVDEDILQRFHCDCMLLYPPWQAPMRWNPRGKYTFGMPATMAPTLNDEGYYVVTQGERTMLMPRHGFFFDGGWLGTWREGDEDAVIDLYAGAAERIYKETPYATNYMGYGAYFGGLERCVTMLLDPDRVREENEVACQANIEHVGKVIDAMGEWVQLISINADMGFQNGPMCRPSLVEELVAPYIKRFCDFVHRNSDCKVFHHCCGSIKPLLPALIDAGVDAMNPVQISAENMDPHELVAEYGDDLVFWGGGCDTQNVLGVASPDEVAANVRELVRTFKRGSGYVFNAVHNIQANVPPENVVAMFDTAYAESFCDGVS